MSSANPPHRAFHDATRVGTLRDLYETRIRPTNARGKDGVHPERLALDIRSLSSRLSEKMRDGSHRFTTYRERLLSKGSGKAPRVLSIATARDRIVLKSLGTFLREVYPDRVVGTAQSRVDDLQVGIATGRYDAFLRMDIQEFFPSIDHAALMRVLEARIRKRQPLELIQRSISTPTTPDGRRHGVEKPIKGVPQGLAISNDLAEIVMGTIDSLFADRDDIFYCRFVDDVIILCTEASAEAFFAEFRIAAAGLGLRVHPLGAKGSKSAIGLIRDGFSYLGYHFNFDSISVRDESVHRVEAAIARVFTRYRHQSSRSKNKKYQKRVRRELAWRLDLIITGCTFHRVRRGWVAYYSKITDLSVLKRLDAIVDRNVRRFGVDFETKPKSFMRSHWRINFVTADSAAYIPNFDRFTNVQKRKLLVKVLGEKNAGAMTNAQIDSHFSARVFKIVRELETHIGDVS